MFKNKNIFDYFERFQKKKMMPPLKSVVKVGKIMWTLNYILSFKKMLSQLEEINREKNLEY